MYNNILVIGASGKTGSRVVKGLADLGITAKRAGRSEPIKFDWQDTKTWQPAIQGIEAIYLTYYPDLAVPKAPEDINLFCKLAADAGVKHITLLSGRGEPSCSCMRKHCQTIRFIMDDC